MFILDSYISSTAMQVKKVLLLDGRLKSSRNPVKKYAIVLFSDVALLRLSFLRFENY